jgi:hypothetical protein
MSLWLHSSIAPWRWLPIMQKLSIGTPPSMSHDPHWRMLAWGKWEIGWQIARFSCPVPDVMAGCRTSR